MNRIIFKIFVVLSLGLLVFLFSRSSKDNQPNINQETKNSEAQNPLAITAMRNRDYPGSNIKIEEILEPAGNYNQYIVSYYSDGLKIYALLTVPQGEKPKSGWPVILFNHGYIPPEVYRTTERYTAYVDYFAKNGYIVFKPDYRGNGNSQGQPEGAYYSPAYTIDDLNALSSIKKYKDADKTKIGIWGHSMGGNITLRDIVVRPNDVKAAVIWGGVVGSYEDLMFNWQRKVPYRPSPRELSLRNRFRQDLVNKYGDPRKNPNFWNLLDPTHFVSDIKAPVQLHAGGNDEEVPVAFSASLRDKLSATGKKVEFYEYEGSDHNISQGFDLAMQRSLEFFDKYVKEE